MAKLTEYIGLNIDEKLKKKLDDEVKKTNGMFSSVSHLIRFIITNYFSDTKE
jgi:Arc/MetJ-type ribon-helix-helix transcriptional regulator